MTEGFDVAEKISKVATHEKTGRPVNEVQIISISINTDWSYCFVVGNLLG